MTGKRKAKAKLRICPHEIYDGTIAKDYWPIGVKASYPDTLLKNITAASVACLLQVESVDYVRKKYLKNWQKEKVDLDPSKFDLQVTHFLNSQIHELHACVIGNSFSLIYSDMQTISDATLLKVLSTVRAALDLSAKGFLHEVLMLCRSSLEMIMWAVAIFDLASEDDPFKFVPEKSIKGFKKFVPYVGTYYGYLSEFSHWRPQTHEYVFDFESETLAVRHTSGRNKWETTANVILLLRIYTEIYLLKYKALKTNKGAKSHMPNVRKVSRALDKQWKKWAKFYGELEQPSVSQSFLNVLQAKRQAADVQG